MSSLTKEEITNILENLGISAASELEACFIAYREYCARYYNLSTES